MIVSNTEGGRLMNSVKAFVSRHSVLITIIIMAVCVIAIMVAGGAPICFNP